MSYLETQSNIETEIRLKDKHLLRALLYEMLSLLNREYSKSYISTTEIIALEKSALEKWNQGNPSGYLDIYPKCITYFDPFQKKRLDGFDAVERLYEGLRGEVSVESYEIRKIA